MDAYVLGKHEGELPTHLLNEGELGNRVRAMAKLDGPDHDVFYAIEAPDEAAFQQHVESLTSAGTQATYSPMICVGDVCIPPVGGGNTGNTHPSFLPPWERYLFYVLSHPGDPVEGKLGPVEALNKVREILGEEGVAAGSDGKGKAIIELGANDQALLDQAHAVLSENFRDNLSGGHAVVGGILKP